MSHARRAILTLALLAALVVQPVAAAGLSTTAPTASAAPASAEPTTATATAAPDLCDIADFGTVVIALTTGFDPVKCNEINAAQVEEIQQTEKNETMIQIHTQAQVTGAKDDTYLTTLSNYMNETRSGALRTAQNELIREINTGTSGPGARAEARQAIADYYAAKQTNVLNTWSVYAEEFSNFRSAAQSSGVRMDPNPGVWGPYVTLSTPPQTVEDSIHVDYDGGVAQYEVTGDAVDETYTLENGDSLTYSAIPVRFAFYYLEFGDYHHATNAKVATVDPLTDTSINFSGGSYTWGSQGDFYNLENVSDIEALQINDPQLNLGLGEVEYVNIQQYVSLMDRLGAQYDEVISEFSTFADAAVPAIENGEITTADLISPSLAIEEYAADNSSFQEFTMLYLQQLGINTPENVDGLGTMLIEDKSEDPQINTTYQGILLSDGTPASGSYQVGTTYDAANISGKQVVATDSEGAGMVELTGEFTILEAIDTSGQNVSDLTYRDTETAAASNITAFREEVDRLRQALAEINARQAAQTNTSNGGNVNFNVGLPSLGSLPRGAVLIVVAFAAILVFQLLSN